MRTPLPALLLLALLVLLPLLPPARADDGPPGSPDPALVDALRAHREGRHGDAEARLRKMLEGKDAPPAAAAALARLLEETGRTAEAVALAERAAAGDPVHRVLLGNLQFSAGRLAEAEKTLAAAADSPTGGAAAEAALGDLLRATGRRKEALERYVRANGLWADGTASSTEDLLAVVRARFAIMEIDPGFKGQMQSTLDILADPLKAGDPDAAVLLADIYTRHDETGRVANALRPVLDRNPLHVEALVVAARAKEARFESGEAAELATKALSVNPVHPGAAGILALMRYGDGDRAGAERIVHRALEAHPADRVLLSLEAVPPYLDGNKEEFEKAAKRVLEIDPAFGGAFLLAARVLEDRRRFAEAAALSRRAAAVDPGDPEAWYSLGRNLLNLGEEKEARTALDRADAADPWHDILRTNFRKVLDELAGYAGGTTAHFDIRIHAAEDSALRPLYEKALEGSFEALKKRYGFTPETPIYAEVFRNAGDFSARTVGVPGFSAVGACFGRVVTLDSPGALPPGAFAWKSTAHHEMAHVFHLQMTGGRVPRWFTEGLSVHEERVANPSWVRNMDRELASAMANGEVKGLLQIDGAFRGPSIMWAYYQGGLMCDWLERDYGLPKILEMLRLYGEDLDNAAVVRRALGLAPAEFDAAFLRYCARLTEGWAIRPRWSDAKFREFRRRSDADPKDLEAHLLLGEACLQQGSDIDAGTALARARALAPKDPFLTELRGMLALAGSRAKERDVSLLKEAFAAGRDHFDLRMLLAADAERAGKAGEAVEHWRKAKIQFPRASGPMDPRRELARVYAAQGKPEEAERELAEMAAIGESDIDTRLKLASVFEGRGDHAAAARMLGEILDIIPIPGRDARGKPSSFPAAEVHARYGAALVGLGRKAAAAAAYPMAVVVGRTQEPRVKGEDLAPWLVGQARAARDAGRLFEAKAAAADALRTDPSCAEAAELLQALGE